MVMWWRINLPPTQLLWAQDHLAPSQLSRFEKSSLVKKEAIYLSQGVGLVVKKEAIYLSQGVGLGLVPPRVFFSSSWWVDQGKVWI